MARRNQLRGEVVNLARRFVSRNNDFGGYWALGQLCAFALQRSKHQLILGLSSTRSMPYCTFTRRMAGPHRAYLSQRLAALGLREEQISSAAIHVEFDFASEVGRGAYRCKVEAALVDNRGVRYSHVVSSKCWPHDPSRELRRRLPDESASKSSSSNPEKLQGRPRQRALSRGKLAPLSHECAAPLRVPHPMKKRRIRTTRTHPASPFLFAGLALGLCALLWHFLDTPAWLNGHHGQATPLLAIGVPVVVAVFLYDPVTSAIDRVLTRGTDSPPSE